MLETFLICAVSLALFAMGISVGALIENRRLRSIIEKSYQEEIDHPIQVVTRVNNDTPIDFEWADPDATLEIPAYDRLVN